MVAVIERIVLFIVLLVVVLLVVVVVVVVITVVVVVATSRVGMGEIVVWGNGVLESVDHGVATHLRVHFSPRDC